MKNRVTALMLMLLFGLTVAVQGASPIRLASSPAVSPNGSQLAFSWRGDIWRVPISGGRATAVTTHESEDAQPAFSPDGQTIAFVSNRTGSSQVYVVPVTGGEPTQLTFHTEGYAIEQWYPDGDLILTSGVRDHFWKRSSRFFTISASEPQTGEKLLFDAYGQDAAISPDGKSVLFVRESTRWWRKGYRGSQAGQIWLYTTENRKFRQLRSDPAGCRYPMWAPDGEHFYYVCGRSGAFNLWKGKLDSDEDRQLTDFTDDSVVFPAIAQEGSTIVFRHLFDLYSLDLVDGKKPEKIEITYAGDEPREDTLRRTVSTASDVTFTSDGLEIAFIAGGDVWVMDTELREPKQVTNTPEEERDVLFSPDNNTLLFVSDKGQQADIWSAQREDADKYWWQNESFQLKQLTDDSAAEARLSWSPKGKHIAYVKSRGELWIMQPDGSDAKRIIDSWNGPSYDWSPDDNWITYSLSDNDFNSEIYIQPLDGSRPPFNVSVHPRNDYSPRWSPDGSIIAFTGQRTADEVDVYYVYLQKERDDESSRDRTMKKAVEKMEKTRKKKSAPPSNGDDKPTEDRPKPKSDEPQSEPKSDPQQNEPAGKGKDDGKTKAEEEKDGQKSEEPSKESEKPLEIDFDGLRDRIHRIGIADSRESGLFWSHDSKKLAMNASVDGKRGTYTVEFPDSLKPKLLTTDVGSHTMWISQGDQILWLSKGVPTSVSGSNGKATAYSFKVRQATNIGTRYETTFMQCWREMRDNFYDARLNNRNWDAIYRKYAPLAHGAVNRSTLADVISLMLGELNGSHLGFSPSRESTGSSSSDKWRETTSHLGLRFDRNYRGPGWKVRDVILDGAADKAGCRIEPNEIVLSVDGQEVDPDLDVTLVLNGPAERDVRLEVANTEGDKRTVVIRPMSYTAARSALYEMWIRNNRKLIDEASDDKFGYLHIRSMDMGSFHRFEAELYKVGYGKDALVIDVRENGGGFTTDHLLTALTQPDHAITVPRGGGPGYPHDRRVYATWNKPIVVLCNQNSFSNAEIFSHAIKTLKRGRLVGVPTSGSVISTGGTSIMDMGFLRLPFRGWFLLNDGADMELNGAVPHVTVWPLPGEMPSGHDRQLLTAAKLLRADVKKWQKRKRPALRTAAEQRAAAEANAADE